LTAPGLESAALNDSTTRRERAVIIASTELDESAENVERNKLRKRTMTIDSTVHHE
jgi:hypothetical protein